MSDSAQAGALAEETLRWAVAIFGPKLVMTSGFGLNGAVLIHILQAITKDVPVIFVDTGYLFEETLETKREIEAIYGVQVLTYRSAARIYIQAAEVGPGLSHDWTHLCCSLRKIEPMRQAVANLRPAAILNARARFQATTRRSLPAIEWDQQPVRINPLALWSWQQIRDYALAHNVPHNPLYDQGYPSVGCWPCTRAVAEGEDVRAGRWPGLGRLECGLWTLTTQVSQGGSRERAPNHGLTARRTPSTGVTVGG